MTSYEPSNGEPSNGEPSNCCPRCQREMVLRHPHPYPVFLQSAFGLSFIIFMLYHIRGPWIWIWCFVQVVLGLLLIRGRIKAKKIVFRCIRCMTDLR